MTQLFTAMFVWIAYDIGANALRVRVAKRCRRLGLQRLQKSVFIGPTRADLLAEFLADIRPLLPTSDRLAVARLRPALYRRLVRQADARTGLRTPGKEPRWLFF